LLRINKNIEFVKIYRKKLKTRKKIIIKKYQIINKIFIFVLVKKAVEIQNLMQIMSKVYKIYNIF
jgi:hypothetical protein